MGRHNSPWFPSFQMAHNTAWRKKFQIRLAFLLRVIDLHWVKEKVVLETTQLRLIWQNNFPQRRQEKGQWMKRWSLDSEWLWQKKQMWGDKGINGFNIWNLSWVRTLPQATFQKKPGTFEGTKGCQMEEWEKMMEAVGLRKKRKWRKINPKS